MKRVLFARLLAVRLLAVRLLAVHCALVVVLGGLWLRAPTRVVGGAGGGDDAALRGLWASHRGDDVGDPLRFYYFHDGGKGLYRYGKVGLNHTNSFDYRARAGRVALTFRKTGARHDVPYTIEVHGAERWLVLRDDPRGPGTVRYRFVPPPKDAGPAATKGPALGGRLWIDQQRYATGGLGFAMYQLNAGAIDGRGVGWFHEGDYDDWSTEALSYRVQGDKLALHFLLRDERAATPFLVDGTQAGADRRRALVLASDPRGFWHRRRFLDGGPSFGSAALSRLARGLDAPAERR